MINKKRNIIQKYIFVISIIALIVYTFRVTTIFDEDYSLTLAKHTFTNIIKLDSLDVHPPLYYFLLKLFIQITTFWTNSIIVKILFARTFSVVISVITFIILVKIINVLHLKISVIVQWIAFLIVPGVISFTYEFIKIRMYSLGALFVALELLYLLKYVKSKKFQYLCITTLSVILSSYTNYYAMLIAGIILFVYIVKCIIIRNNDGIKLFVAGLFSLIAFIPWMPILLKQLYFQSSHTQGGFLKQWIATFILILIFIYPLVWAHRYLSSFAYNTFFYMFNVLVILFFIMTLISFIDTSVFQFRYLYPIYVIYGYLGVNVLFLMIKTDVKFTNLLSRLIVCILCLFCFGAYSDQFKFYNIPSISIIRQFNKWNDENSNKITLRQINNSAQGFNVEKSIYLSTINKRIVAPNNIKFMDSNPAYIHLFKNVNSHIIKYK